MYAIKNAKQTKIDLRITIEAILDYSCLNCNYLLGQLLIDNSHEGCKYPHQQMLHIYSEKRKIKKCKFYRITIPTHKEKKKNKSSKSSLRSCIKSTYCTGFVWPGFGSWGHLEDWLLRDAARSFSLCLTEPMPALSRTQPAAGQECQWPRLGQAEMVLTLLW